MLSSLVRLVLAPGVCSLPSCDWFSRRVYALFPRAIGSRAGCMLSSLVRLVLAAVPQSSTDPLEVHPPGPLAGSRGTDTT
eukprot:2869445-Pyramimonas_sp.AAC.1